MDRRFGPIYRDSTPALFCDERLADRVGTTGLGYYAHDVPQLHPDPADEPLDLQRLAMIKVPVLGDPDRFAANQLATQSFSMIGDVHDRVAERLAKITVGPILDLDGGNGTLEKALAVHGRSAIVVDRADYVSSRYNDPDLPACYPTGEPVNFDAETAPEIISEHFKITKVIKWDTPAVRLPDRAGVALFLRGRGLSAEEAYLQSHRWNTPLTVTKRGCLIWARRP